MLWSEFMYPIARINNASLIRDPRRPDPWREGDCWEVGAGAMCSRVSRACAPPQIIILTNVFIGKNLFGEFIKDAPPYIFPLAGDWGDRVTDMLLSSKMQR